MSQIKGPAIHLLQLIGDNPKPPFDTLENITAWLKSLGYLGVQLPICYPHMIDLAKAAESKSYCDELKAKCCGLEITELSAHYAGQLVAVHPAYDLLYDDYVDPPVKGNPKARTEWAVRQIIEAIKASRNLGLNVLPTLSGTLLWPFLFPFLPRISRLVDLAFEELAKRWQPILNAAEEYGVDLAYEVHPVMDIHDGVTFERFLEVTNNHPRVKILYDPSHLAMQCLDYVGFIPCYRDYIKVFHVKDAEFIPSPRSGVYGGYQDWKERPARFRSLGDGQIDFKRLFTLLTEIGFDSWAVLEWECVVKDLEQGAREGAELIKSLLIDIPKRAFDSNIRTSDSSEIDKKILGIK